jgi:hypothetical protein
MGEKGNGGTGTADEDARAANTGVIKATGGKPQGEARVNSELENATGDPGGPEDQSKAVNTSRSNIKNN